MTVTVGIPFYGDEDMLRRCVRSLLRQTYRDLRVLVVGDGQEPRIPTRDSRVQVYTLPQNRGSYFARAVALAATTTEFHGVVDSDDGVDPQWLETLMATGGTAVQHSIRWVERAGRPTVVMEWMGARKPLSENLTHYTSHTGVYATERLRDAGGYSPAYRIGYDSLLAAVVRMQGPVQIVDKTLYHRRIHPDSLSQTSRTKIGSPARLEVRRQLQVAYRRVYRARHDPQKQRRILRRLASPLLWQEVEEHAERIRCA